MRGESLAVLKIGGSVITVKDKALTPNNSAIRRLAKEIADSRFSPLIIVHGGGSFGHPIAAKYGIAEGFKDENQMVGFSETHNAMVKLNMLVVEALLDEGLPAFSMAPSSLIITRGGRIQHIYRDPLEQALKFGFMPVLYGDAVFDYDMGFTVLSGDQILSRLATEFGAERIIIGVDVDGIYTVDPKINPKAQLITRLTLNELVNLIDRIGVSRSIDVTGGMMGKIRELMAPAMNGVNILIVNALKPNYIYKALRGEDVVGTRIIRG